MGTITRPITNTGKHSRSKNAHNPILELSETAPRFTESYIYTSIRDALSNFKSQQTQHSQKVSIRRELTLLK
jgi:hypothetical protein